MLKGLCSLKHVSPIFPPAIYSCLVYDPPPISSKTFVAYMWCWRISLALCLQYIYTNTYTQKHTDTHTHTERGLLLDYELLNPYMFMGWCFSREYTVTQAIFVNFFCIVYTLLYIAELPTIPYNTESSCNTESNFKHKEIV